MFWSEGVLKGYMQFMSHLQWITHLVFSFSVNPDLLVPKAEANDYSESGQDQSGPLLS